MANRSRQRAQRRNQIIMGIFAVLLILSMMISLLVSFTGPTTSTTSTQPQATVISVTPKP